MATEKIDHTHPLLLQPSDTSGLILIRIQLTGSENYGLWSRSMRLALKAKRKLGFVTGTCAKELYKDAPLEEWETCNAIELWVEYDVLVPFSDCGYPRSKEHITHLPQQRVVQFLDDLNDTYDQAR
ncbi:uncharacterized protein LOC142165910 [Nicotiana tabacum]|uniref:Uncharacterized protein LOC142165910 n=1 Tax=Nicotiana tabacum TaxID=4097 RepID=A0AC58S611_TOBAC